MKAMTGMKTVVDEEYTYVYDEDGNLIEEAYTDTYWGESWTNTYEYDEDGNLVSETYESDWDGDGVSDDPSSIPTPMTKMETLVSESYSSDWDGDGIADDSYAYTYDADGNILSETYESDGEMYHFEYDADGNLLTEEYGYDLDGDGIVDESDSYHYGYDADGNLVYQAYYYLIQ